MSPSLTFVPDGQEVQTSESLLQDLAAVSEWEGISLEELITTARQHAAAEMKFSRRKQVTPSPNVLADYRAPGFLAG